MMSKLSLAIVIITLMTLGVIYVYDFVEEKIEDQQENIEVYNPSTGEIWESVKEYRFRNSEVEDASSS